MELTEFAREHVDEDTARLLLSAARYPHIDMPAAVQQIEGLRTAREKWPSLLGCEDYLYPARLNREQASSEATAAYKARLAVGTTLADLTGGMGVDSVAFAREGCRVDYVERSEELCHLMLHNVLALGLGDRIGVHHADSMEWLESQTGLDTLYIDPARRSASGRKVAAFEECQPDILLHLDLLRQRCSRLIVKASPMIDIDLAVDQLSNVAEVHVVAVGGECKEVLFVCGSPHGEPQIVCCNLSNQSNLNTPSTLTFTRGEDLAARPVFCTAVGRYLYEPNVALMKGGCFNLVGARFGLEKLAPNTHLYTAERMVDGFPGRVFEVVQEVALSRKAVARVLPEGKAHVMTRNYPVEAAELQHRLGLREGGELYIVAATVGRRPTGFLCRRMA